MGKHTMLEYIMDQPRALRHTLDNRQSVTEDIVRLFASKPIRKVYFLGSGTSYHASLMAKRYFEKYLGVEAAASIPTVFTYYENINNNGVYQKDEILVIAISQTGTSISTINAVKKAKDEGYATVVLTEALGSTITQYADVVIHLLCGKEEIPPETRGYTVTLLTMFLWTIAIAKHIGKITAGAFDRYIAQAEKLIDAFPGVLEDSKKWYQRNKYGILTMQKADIAGYGNNFVTALEGALKVGETLHRKITGTEMEELIHGPEMGYDANNFLFIIAAKEVELERTLQNREFFLGLTDHVFTITLEDIKLTCRDLKLNAETIPELAPLIYVVPFQVMSALACQDIGIDTSVYPHEDHGMSHEHSDNE